MRVWRPFNGVYYNCDSERYKSRLLQWFEMYVMKIHNDSVKRYHVHTLIYHWHRESYYCCPVEYASSWPTDPFGVIYTRDIDRFRKLKKIIIIKNETLFYNNVTDRKRKKIKYLKNNNSKRYTVFSLNIDF